MGTSNTPHQPERPDRPERPDPRQDLPNPEAALGGADAVEKTSYVTGKGTEPSDSSAGKPVATAGSGGGLGGLGWAIGALVVLGAIALLLGMFR